MPSEPTDFLLPLYPELPEGPPLAVWGMAIAKRALTLQPWPVPPERERVERSLHVRERSLFFFLCLLCYLAPHIHISHSR